MKKVNPPRWNVVAVGGAVCAMLCLIFAPGEAIGSARYALSLCAELIVPSLLPFFAASALLIRLQIPASLGALLAPAARRLWGVSGTGASAFLAGICGGYPLGAQTVAEMYGEGQLTKGEAERLLAFCNNSGPSFLVGVIGGGVFSSRRAGLLLYAIHVASALLTGMLFRAKGEERGEPLPRKEIPPFSEALVGAVRQAVSAVLSVCGFVICFCVLSGLLDSTGFYHGAAILLGRICPWGEDFVRAFLVGLLELGSGIGQLRGQAPSVPLFALAAFLAGWGGLSVQFQTAAVLSESDLSLRCHLAGRILSGSISALLALLASGLLFPSLLCAA